MYISLIFGWKKKDDVLPSNILQTYLHNSSDHDGPPRKALLEKNGRQQLPGSAVPSFIFPFSSFQNGPSRLCLKVADTLPLGDKLFFANISCWIIYRDLEVWQQESANEGDFSHHELGHAAMHIKGVG